MELLNKKGRVDIQIVKKGPHGQIELRWEVSYSERYGQARQFAYKLDTIVINHRLDEEGRPLPELIRLGSLRDIAQQLDLDGSGDSTNRIRRALHQNAGAYITAKIKYRTSHGGERTLEAGFTRYSLVFTGEQLPDGRKADAVYLLLNKPFREVINAAPIRPLNYNYLKSLAPAPQRFYEIISSRIFATLKNSKPFARILYSDFCIFSALTRHLDHENFRVQIAKIHRPHLKSGYITKVHYEKTTDGEGRADWMMCYAPGPRARAEYMTFARKSKQLEAQAELDAAVPAPIQLEQGNTPDPAPAVDVQPLEPNAELLTELTQRGIIAARAKKLLSELAEGQHVLDQLEWGDYLIRSQPEQFKNPAGFYVYLVTNKVLPPPTFETSRQRKLREDTPRTPTTVSQYTLPFLATQIAELSVCPVAFRKAALAIRYHLDLLNQSATYLQSLGEKAAAELSTQGQLMLMANLEEGYRKQGSRAELIVKLIEDMKKRYPVS